MENTAVKNFDYEDDRLVSFIVGVGLGILSIALFIVGIFFLRTPMWITAAVIGAGSLVICTITVHGENGWFRMYSVLTLITVVAVITAMALLSFIL